VEADPDKFCGIYGIEKSEIETIYQRQLVQTGCLYLTSVTAYTRNGMTKKVVISY